MDGIATAAIYHAWTVERWRASPSHLQAYEKTKRVGRVVRRQGIGERDPSFARMPRFR